MATIRRVRPAQQSEGSPAPNLGYRRVSSMRRHANEDNGLPPDVVHVPSGFCRFNALCLGQFKTLAMCWSGVLVSLGESAVQSHPRFPQHLCTCRQALPIKLQTLIIHEQAAVQSATASGHRLHARYRMLCESYMPCILRLKH